MSVTRLIAIFFLAGSIAFIPQAGSRGQTSHAGAATVLAVRNLLSEALEGLQRAINTAGSEFRSSLEQMQKNAQNVIADIDSSFGKNSTKLLKDLDAKELRLVEDARLLADKLNTATNQMLNNAGEQARQTIADADILAYDAVYSLPCRSKIPRIVYAYPKVIRIGADPAELSLRGNYLDFGAPPLVSVNGAPAQLIARTATEMRVALPDSALSRIATTQSVGVQLAGMTKDEAWPLVCWLTTFYRSMSDVLSASAVIEPALSIAISAKIDGTWTNTEAKSFQFRHDDTDNDCGANRPSDQTFCLPTDGDWRVTSWGLNRESANCSSEISDPSASGSRCIFVSARVSGCGYDDFGIAKNCKGRGWVHYNVIVQAARPISAAIPEKQFQASSPNGVQTSYVFDYRENTFVSPEWRYTARVDIKVGTEPVRTLEISDGNPNFDGISSRLVNGRLSIDVDRSHFLH